MKPDADEIIELLADSGVETIHLTWNGDDMEWEALAPDLDCSGRSDVLQEAVNEMFEDILRTGIASTHRELSEKVAAKSIALEDHD